MAILKIARMGHPVLAGAAAAVEDPTASDILRLADDMVETMMDAPGIGLAAPQVHVAKRVVVFCVPEEGTDDGAGLPITILVNPEIEPLGEEVEIEYEGCLSVPGMTGAVPRYTRIGYRALTPAGKIVEREASGYHARVVQHECDHLDGVLYPMRMSDLSTFGFVEEVARRRRQAEDDAPAEPE